VTGPGKQGEGARVALRGAAFGYDGRAAVRRLDGVFEPGSLTAIVGPNGAGKSTLIKGVAGLLAPLAGDISRSGLPAPAAYLPQRAEIDRSFPARVADLVALGLWTRRGLLARLTPADRAGIDAALSAVGLENFGRREIGALSGGEFQRMLFARVLLQDAPLILLDEPFSAVDQKTVADLLAIIHRWHAEGRTVLVAVHNVQMVREHFPETLLLDGEPVAWGRTADVLRPENLHAAAHGHENACDEPAWLGRSAA
jgi:zinc/manganese transport system ATP-binding protein